MARHLALAGLLVAIVGASIVAQQAAGIPGISPQQTQALTELTAAIAPLADAAAAARDRLVAATLTVPRSAAAISAGADALKAAERTLAVARADAFSALQSSPARFAPGQVAALVAIGGSFLRAAGRGGN
ncbi:MAG TPA: hypothetical protein VKE96_01910, partial [Vicinamibacterales bacterium]|nr:hypothetical protein [Vicinamibacterales bacterium]